MLGEPDAGRSRSHLARAIASSAARGRTPAATAGPTCGSGDTSAGSTKAHTPTWTPAFRQLRQYTLALDNPPLLIVCDLQRFRIHTSWTNSVSETHEFGLEDLRDSATRDKLKWALSDPERLRPGETRQDITEARRRKGLPHLRNRCGTAAKSRRASPTSSTG